MKTAVITGKPKNKTKLQFKKYWPFYLMMLPGLLYYLIFKYGPMAGVIIAFKDYNIMDGIWGSPWADPWYKHFSYFFNSPYAKQVIGNTIIISLMKLVAGMIPPIILAIMISECKSRRFAKIVQTATYLPHFLSWVIVYGILIAFFSQSTGLINRWIRDLGGTTYPFLTSPDHFRAMLVGSEVWKTTGWAAIIYIAAISGIDSTLYEAATIDGCNRWKRIWHITLPCLRSVIILQLILKVGNILDAGFDQIYIMMNAQVASVSEIIDTWVFTEGLTRMNYSLASAVGLLKSVLGCILVFSTNKLARKWDEGLW